MLRTILYSFLFAFCGVLSAHADQVKYAQVDSEALSIPTEYTYSVDSLALYIRQKFKTPETQARAIYVWMTHHLTYNVYPTFVSRNEVNDDAKQVASTLRTRSGICRQFSLLFQALATRLGIETHTVIGYTKSGTVVMPEVHQWCVARMGSQWSLFDVTFGAGFVEDYKFTPSPNDAYFMVFPQQAIRTHMPFDPLWQLLERPYSYEEFKAGAIDSGRKVAAFRYTDSIATFTRQSWELQLKAANHRALNNGKGNELLDYFIQLNRANIQIAGDVRVIDIHNRTMALQNRAVDSLMLFIRYRQAEFRPKKTEKQVRRMIEVTEELMLEADSLINTILVISPKYKEAVMNLRKSIIELATQTFKHKIFVERYYATKPSLRKQLLSE